MSISQTMPFEATDRPGAKPYDPRYDPLVGAGAALEDSKALAIERIKALKARLL